MVVGEQTVRGVGGRTHVVLGSLLILGAASCSQVESAESYPAPPVESKNDSVVPVCTTPMVDVPAPVVTIDANDGKDEYGLTLRAPGTLPGSGWVRLEVATSPEGPFEAAGEWATTDAQATGVADKFMSDIYARTAAFHESGCVQASAAARLAKPDYADPESWGEGWIRVVSHNHTIPDIKEDAGEHVHANRINWFNGCFDVADGENCHDLLLRSFSEDGLQWMMDAATDHEIDSVIITDHDNVGIWYTDIFRRFNQANPDGPSVVAGLEWTSGLGHLTVIGNFLPAIDPDADIFNGAQAKEIHTSVPLPEDHCDDTDENHDINAPEFDGPDSPCAREDGRGYGDDPVTAEDTRKKIQEMQANGALVFVNHPTNDPKVQPAMKWRLENLDIVDGVEVGVPDPTFSNRDTPEYWRERGLMEGHRWVPISGTDCHVDDEPYTGDTGCNDQWGVVHLTHLDAPYMWIKPLQTTSAAALNDPNLVVSGIRDGRVVVVQDKDPAVVVDLGIDANDDGMLDYWSGTTVPGCEQPQRDEFTVQVRVKPEQRHDYNVSVWRLGDEEKILQDERIDAGETWTKSVTFSRSKHIPSGSNRGYIMVQVRENKTAAPDNDAGFATPIWFEMPSAGVTDCHTRDVNGE